ncbi:MAG: glycosyltransferase family 4 protein [Proteobacteria bacterium]|nr:glycosyltransferase family 4 protein [Pseudomonadota bacterium]HQR03427.1 glycosyltransferase family 4 protein [Rhodocyclaceae bacterium]
MTTRIAYFINQYPQVSHAFIRREMLALERMGFEIERFALRGWDAEIIDEIDFQEQIRTRYVLENGVLPLAFSMLLRVIRSPLRFLDAMLLSIRMGWKADRPLPYHLVYLAEACHFLTWLQDREVDHIHAHFGTNSAEVVMLTHALGGPTYSFTVHGPLEFDRPYYLGIGEKIRHAAFVVAITSFCRSQLFRWVGHTHWPKIQVVHCGLEDEFFAGTFSHPSPTPRLVCVGRLCEQKGQLLLIEAAAKVASSGHDFKLVLVGGGEMRSEIEALVVRHGINDKVEFTGPVSTERLREELLKAQALVLASFAEGLPMVIMEAMALRRPVLSTFVAGIPELVVPGETGWLIPAGSVDDLATAMTEIITTPPERLHAMGNAAHARVVGRHSIDTEVARLADLFVKYARRTGSPI